VGKETGEASEELGMVKETIKTPFKQPSLASRVRSKIARILIDIAYRISWDGYVESMSDGEFGYCPDCEQCYNPEGRCR
jgi:hypothetical protein